MEKLYSHSKPPTFSSKTKPPPPQPPYNNAAFFSTTSYDDVFGGPPKFASSSSLAPRPEDYSEIFGGFRLTSSSSSSTRASSSSSSIPVLDLPAVPDDIGAAFFDYSEVFGGFNAVDFAVPFDQLFHPCDGAFVDDEDEDDVHGDLGGGGGGCSSDEAWTPVGTDSLSDESDQFASSERSQCFSSMNPHQQSESKLFNVSYHKVNPGTNANIPNTVHVAQLNDMPGFTCVVDEATLFREIGKEKCSTVDDTQKITLKTGSHSSDGNFGQKAHNSDLNPSFAPISEVNLGTEPSHFTPPSKSTLVVAEMSGEFNVPRTDLNASEKCGSEETVDCALPPFFDMEVDANSFAAASAAAVEDAMEKAQAKMKTAKESRDRKDKTQNCGKLHLHNEANGGESIQRPRHESLSEEIRVHATDRGPSKIKVESVRRPLDETLTGETIVYATDKGPSKIKVNAKSRHTKDTSQNLLNILSIDQLNGVPEQPAETKQGKRKSLSKDNALTDVAGQWKEATQYYEFVNSENTQSAPRRHSTDGDAKIKIMHQDDNDDFDSGGEAYVAGENRRRLKVTKAVSRQDYYEKMVKVALEVHDGVKCGNLGPDKKSKHMPQRNPRQQKPESVYEPQMLEIPLCRNQEMQETPGEGFSNEFENEEEGSQACHSNQFDKNVKGLESMVEVSSFVNQRNSRGSCKKDEGDYSVQDTLGRGQEQRAQKESSKQKRDKEAREAAHERSAEASEGVLIGGTMQAAYRSEEKDNTSEWQTVKAADRRLKEACENMSVKDTMLAGKRQENNVTRNLQQRHGHENHVGKEGDGLGSKRTLQKCVKQDKCVIEKNVSEQAIGMQRLCETHDLIDETKSSEEGEKPDADEVKPEKATELEHVEFNSLQACEMDELWCKLEEAVDGQGPEITLKRSVELEKGAVNTEVLEQAMRMEKLDDARDSIADTNNSEESQGQDEKKKKLEKTAAQEHELLKKCELRETTKINEDTGDEDHKGLYRSSKTFVWEDEDQGLTSPPYMEPAVENKNFKPSNGAGHFEDVDQNNFCKLRKPEKKGDGFKAESEGNELKVRTSQASDMIGLNGDNDVSASHRTEQIRKKEKKEKKESFLSTSDLNLEKNISVQGGTKRNQADSQIIFDQEESVRSTPTEHASREEVTQTVLPEKERPQKTSLMPNGGQSPERKGKIMNHNCLSEDKDGEKERDLENERLQKLEEEKERLREREKDRMAVEMTIREARDRAYADARDRAGRAALEKATDDARQRAMTEARERLEKACAEARERSLADREARLRAERAAVERATAEARQRAIEKAMAERTTFEARDRMQRSVSEKYMCEREVIMRQSSFPASNERFDTSNSEPAQRCKARLERHRRTVERVAKALAEKNMRDLVAQREQAERTRLAETLDADIRRWSSGKEGNLRALLSTLQYILGPDSGWQPIPLTEVITAAAVKKAYRKATLCVHPDKLQQRGASIQQKYICEKVFDLLKEAWNKFNSEEK